MQVKTQEILSEYCCGVVPQCKLGMCVSHVTGRHSQSLSGEGPGVWAALVRMNAFYYDAGFVPCWRTLDEAAQRLLLKNGRTERRNDQKGKCNISAKGSRELKPRHLKTMTLTSQQCGATVLPTEPWNRSFQHALPAERPRSRGSFHL